MEMVEARPMNGNPRRIKPHSVCTNGVRLFYILSQIERMIRMSEELAKDYVNISSEQKKFDEVDPFI